jgi:hypothetical protein
MAEHAGIEFAGATSNNYPAHEVTLVKATMAVVTVIVVLMAFFLT